MLFIAVHVNQPFSFITFVGSYVADGKEYMFSMNVCGNSEVPICSDKEAAVCQVKKADSTQAKIAGRHQNQTLRCVKAST
jgi:hypothetical protein